MKITDFLSPNGVQLQVSAADKTAVINIMADMQVKVGNVSDAQKYKADIIAREEKGSTAVGMGIAVPHAKSEAVTKAGVVAITVPEGVDYKSLDKQPSKLFFMIAAPAKGADTHLEVLSKLMTMLMVPGFSQSLLDAKTPEEFVKIIDEAEAKKDAETAAKSSAAKAPASKIKVVGVTACPTGIAHTYMAAEALEQKAKTMDVDIKVETDGSDGAKNILTDAEIAAADVVIVAADRNVEMARFNGKKVIKASTADAIHHSDELLNKAKSGNVPVYNHVGGGEVSKASSGTDETLGRKFYKHLMNGVSHMLPFTVGGGIMVALAFLIDTLCGYGATGGGNFGTMVPLSAFFKYVGGLAMGLMVPVLAGYIAESIADRPGLAVGFTGGLLAANGNAAISGFVWGSDVSQLSGFQKFIANFAFQNTGNTVSGFLGGIAAGFLAGAIVLWLKKLTAGFPKSLEGIKPILIYPLCGIFIIGLVMCFILNPFIGFINTLLSAMLTAISDAGMLVLLGLILGAMMAIDMGGPINKAAYVFGTGMLATASQLMDAGSSASDPAVQACYIAMASIMIGGMVPPIGIALACQFFPKKFTLAERETKISNIIMGFSFITEGAIPFAAADPAHVIPCTLVGSAVAGLLSALFKCTLMAPHGGIFVFATVGNPLLYIVALLIGSVVTCAMLGFIKKDVEA
ncbi:MAG: fructose-specific PTS transporter subunit EIIC [Butyrivibrio sp.]|nr:fructose-specific PTS transporter subunit EIIC [Butyrivibrio sp.]